MDDIIKLLAGFEETAYKILMLVIIIPKTLLKIIFDPVGARKYVDEQLDLIEKNKTLAQNERVLTFADYLSPVLLLLILALVPALLLTFLPSIGVAITTSAVQDSPTQYLFTAKASFSSPAQGKGYQFKWEVQNQDNQLLVYAESHLDNNAGRGGIKYDNNTATDTYNYNFDSKGNYNVQVSVMDQDGNILFQDNKSVSVTPDSKDQNKLKASVANITDLQDKDLTLNQKKDLTVKSFSDLLEKDTTIFLAFALLLPPLFFAFVYSLATHKQLTEKDMRKIFYVECYYFSPLSVAIWAFYYSLYFLTGGALQFTVDWNFVPPLLALIWFVSVETNALADESEDDNITRPIAFFIVVACIIAITVVGLVISLSIADVGVRDAVRRFIIGIYLFISFGLIGIYFVNRRKAREQAIAEKKTEMKDRKTPISPRLKWIAYVSLSIVLCCVVVAGISVIPDLLITSSGPAPLATPTSSNDKLPENDNWNPPIVIGGDQSEASKSNYNNGSADINLKPKPNEDPSAYYLYKAKEYSNVQIETKAKSNNDNAHSISLICRYNDAKGWYEFEVNDSGDYYIYQVDLSQDTVNKTITANYNHVLTSGNSPLVSKGLENTYAANCSDNDLSLSINNNLVATVKDPEVKITQGLVGVGMYSPEGKEIDLQLAYVTITGQPSQPTQINNGASATPTFVPATSLPTNLDAATATPVSDAGASPTQTSMPQAQQYFTEEFDVRDALSNWSNFVVNGDTLRRQDNAQGVSITSGNGALTFDLQAMNLWAYTTYNSSEYDNVRMDIQATNRGLNTNNVSLICRFTGTNWYEFNISNGGEVYIYYAEIQPDNKVNYRALFEGGSAAVKYGHDTNEYAAVCDGNTLSLYINDMKVREVTDNKYNLTSGKIGISVSSFDVLPVTVDVDWVKISKP